MYLRACGAEMLTDDELCFFEVFETVGMNGIMTMWKLAEYSLVDIFNNLAKRFSFYLIERMTSINNSFNNEFS
jgi:hypothetical protein